MSNSATRCDARDSNRLFISYHPLWQDLFQMLACNWKPQSPTHLSGQIMDDVYKEIIEKL